jgi:hypothetical protein
VQVSSRRIGAVVLATAALTGCGASSTKPAASNASPSVALTPIPPARACLSRLNASGQLVPYVTLRRPITGGYVTTDQNLAHSQAACGILLYIKLLPHHGVIPMLFYSKTPDSRWRHALPEYDPFTIGTRARIPGGRPVDVANPLDLRLIAP